MTQPTQMSVSSLLGLPQPDPEPSKANKTPDYIPVGTESNFIPLSWNSRSPCDIYDPSVLFDTIVYIHVGPSTSKRVFGMHKGLLCYHSSYFRAALTGPFSQLPKARNGIIALEDENIDTFERFNGWIYSGLSHKDWSMSQLLDMYIFAEKRLCSKFQNAVVNLMMNLTRHEGKVMSTALFNRAWRSSLRLRPFLVDAFVAEGNLSGAHALEQDFLLQVVRRSTDCWRSYQAVDKEGKHDDEDYMMRVVQPFESACERFHVHAMHEPSCDEELHRPPEKKERGWNG